MTTGGWFFLSSAWGVLLLSLVYCYYHILKKD